jgi:hypothetical protein
MYHKSAKYLFGNDPEIAAFVKEHHLGRLLRQARKVIDQIFGEGAITKLELVKDPEDGFTALYCLIPVAGNWHRALRLLRRFDDLWWTAHSSEATLKLVFDVKLI